MHNQNHHLGLKQKKEMVKQTSKSNCWHEMFGYINHARHSIIITYIAGWIK
uniref:Uncharacterized protein n=1 Tax=Triticum urartu TaxID=4572 RepID=A0A8R7UPT5_TRIUA